MTRKKGFMHSKETRFKISNSLKKEKHFAWKGNKAGYQAIRIWIRKNFKKPKKCENPLCMHKSSNLQWILKKDRKPSRDIQDYYCLCNSCKRKIFFKEETRNKLSSKKGRKISENHRKILSERMKKFNPSTGGLTEEHKRKISKNHSKHMLGKHHTKETKEKLRELNLGEKSSFWQGGKSFEPYTPEFNSLFKNKIRQRDKQMCINCGKPREKLNKDLDVHHINYNKKLTIPKNCISLCRECHILTNSNRKNWEELFQNKLSELYGYKYGIL